ncbi:hypothetical protein MMC10_000886 [Thelotrema lepadinum]|nr:hypothetical protein [Thelotrema lepadinum]
MSDFPFLEYSAIHWMRHADPVMDFEEVRSSVREMVLRYPIFRFSLVICDSMNSVNVSKSPVCYASSEGCTNVVRTLLESGFDANERSYAYGGPLQSATRNGHEDTVRLLLAWDAEVDAQQQQRGNALQIAAFRGNESIVRILLEHGANVNAQGDRHSITSLGTRVISQHAIARILSRSNFDLEAGFHGSALQVAAIMGQEAIVRLLLEHGADIHAKGGYWGNALHAAAATGQVVTTEILIEHGARIYVGAGKFSDFLQAMTTSGRETIVRILREQDALVNATRLHAGTLPIAVDRRKEAIAKNLLKNDTCGNVQSGCAACALGAAFELDPSTIRKLLLDARARDNDQQGEDVDTVSKGSEKDFEDLP